MKVISKYYKGKIYVRLETKFRAVEASENLKPHIEARYRTNFDSDGFVQSISAVEGVLSAVHAATIKANQALKGPDKGNLILPDSVKAGLSGGS